MPAKPTIVGPKEKREFLARLKERGGVVLAAVDGSGISPSSFYGARRYDEVFADEWTIIVWKRKTRKGDASAMPYEQTRKLVAEDMARTRCPIHIYAKMCGARTVELQKYLSADREAMSPKVMAKIWQRLQHVKLMGRRMAK